MLENSEMAVTGGGCNHFGKSTIRAFKNPMKRNQLM